MSKASIHLYTVIYMRKCTLVTTCYHNFTHSRNIKNLLGQLNSLLPNT